MMSLVSLQKYTSSKPSTKNSPVPVAHLDTARIEERGELQKDILDALQELILCPFKHVARVNSDLTFNVKMNFPKKVPNVTSWPELWVAGD